MNRCSHRLAPRFLTLLVAGVGLLALVGIASATPTPAANRAGANNSATFTPAPEYQDPSGPVISNVVVSSDDQTITFQINTPNRPSFTNDMLYAILVDVDNTPSTGNTSEGGAETLLQVSGFTHPAALQRFFWDGRQWGSIGIGSDETWSYSNGVSVTVPRDLVEASGSDGPFPTIRFGVDVWSGLIYDSATRTYDSSNAHENEAPFDLADFYSYDFQPGTHQQPRPPAAIVATKLTLSKARAGKTFTVSMLVTDNQSGLPAFDVELGCRARISGKALPVLNHSVSKTGQATCTWRLPKASRGKQLTGTITASFPGTKSASRSFATRVS
jgi:hypothetical protein